MPQAAEKQLIICGFKYIKARLPITQVGHGGKEIKNIMTLIQMLQKILIPGIFRS